MSPVPPTAKPKDKQHTLSLRMMSLHPVTSLFRTLLRSASLLDKLRQSKAAPPPSGAPQRKHLGTVPKDLL